MPLLGLAIKEKLSPAEVGAYVQGTVGKSAEPFMCEAVARADGRFRKTLFATAPNPGPTQPRSSPIAVVNGGAEPLVNVDYVETVTTPIFGRNTAIVWRGSGTRLFW